MREQKRKKLKGGINEPTRTRKLENIINLVNQQNPKLNKAKSKEQST
jgi:hypothetical protein